MYLIFKMMKKYLLYIVFLTCTLSFQCKSKVSMNEHISIQKGKGHFIFNQYAPLSEKPLDVYYYAPHHKVENLKIVIVMSGVGRNANEYRDAWIEMAKEYHLLIIAPEFSTQFYPGSINYNLGNIHKENGDPNPEEIWSFSLIEPLFEEIKTITKNKHHHYYLFGHSAGAQFVHRFIEFVSDNHVEKAVAANAGWYTIPSQTIDFPYGFKNSPWKLENSKAMFGARLWILLGEDDTDPHSLNLRRSPEVDFQGNNRFDRGKYFYKKSKEKAKDLNQKFKWKIKYVPNVAHDGALMSKAAAKMLFG